MVKLSILSTPKTHISGPINVLLHNLTQQENVRCKMSIFMTATNTFLKPLGMVHYIEVTTSKIGVY